MPSTNVLLPPTCTATPLWQWVIIKCYLNQGAISMWYLLFFGVRLLDLIQFAFCAIFLRNLANSFKILHCFIHMYLWCEIRKADWSPHASFMEIINWSASPFCWPCLRVNLWTMQCHSRRRNENGWKTRGLSGFRIDLTCSQWGEKVNPSCVLAHLVTV